MNAKTLVHFFIKAYQRYAPSDVRDRCCFTPTCSEYMLLAVEKYGVCRGIAAGTARLIRCRPPGGVDYP
jgi:putative membrane protein insertion efficiency factor